MQTIEIGYTVKADVNTKSLRKVSSIINAPVSPNRHVSTISKNSPLNRLGSTKLESSSSIKPTIKKEKPILQRQQSSRIRSAPKHILEKCRIYGKPAKQQRKLQ